MQMLEIKDCARFIAYAHSKVMIKGWLDIVKDYAHKKDDKAGPAVRSWYINMVKGKSFQDSLVRMKVRFPACVESLLIQGYESSVLDQVLRDMNAAFKKHYRMKELYDALSLMVNEMAIKPKSAYICQGCLMRELERILKRAKLERAHEIVFEQEGDKFFIQRYLGPKAVTYIEPCHSKTYKSLLRSIIDWSETSGKIHIANHCYKIVNKGNKRYSLSADETFLILSFISEI